MRKYILLLSVLCILLSLCACSTDSGESNTDKCIFKQDTEEEITGSVENVQEGTRTDVNEVTPSNEDLMNSAVLQYPSQNDDWKYNVYDCYVEVTKYIGEKVESLIIPDEIEGLPVWSYNPELEVSHIGEATLKDTVKSIVLPKNLLIIGENAFSNFANIKNVSLPNGLIIIEKNAFSSCALLEDIAIPETLREIGDGAFNGCSSLKKIILPSSTKKIGNLVFDNTNNNDGIELTVYNSKMMFGSYSSGKFETAENFV